MTQLGTNKMDLLTVFKEEKWRIILSNATKIYKEGK